MRQLARTFRALAALLPTLICTVGLPAVCAAQDPTSGFDRFPEFRNLSGLAGSGFGVDARGYLSLSGPVAFSTPVAHVLGHTQLFAVSGLTSFDSGPEFSTRRSNGTSVLMLGLSLPGVNVAFSDMALSWPHGRNAPVQAFNAQLQPVLRPGSKLIPSLGIQDLGGAGGAAGTNVPGDTRTSRSLFGVLTYRLDTGRSPVYLSGGIGTRRFRRPFGSASWQAVKPLRLWLEQDGYGWNEGLLGAWNFTRGSRPAQLTTMLGYQKGRYFTWSVGVGF